MSIQRTLSIIKPDAVAKNVIGPIIAKLEAAGLRVIASKMVRLSELQARAFYAVHKDRPFYTDLVKFMTEGPVIVQMIADKAADKNLAPSRDHADRYKLQAWLTYINSELHKNLGPQFAPALSDDAKAFFKDRVMGKFKYVDGELAGKDYLMGKQFSVADGYMFTMLSWAERMKWDLADMSNLMAYQARVGARPKVQEALTKEGLMKAA